MIQVDYMDMSGQVLAQEMEDEDLVGAQLFFGRLVKSNEYQLVYLYLHNDADYSDWVCIQRWIR